MKKTLKNTTADAATKNVKDIVFYGDGDTFKLISKASSEAEGWMKSTKAMEIPNVGCVVQVTTQQAFDVHSPIINSYDEKAVVDTHYVVAEALTFVPGVRLEEIDGDKMNGRRLVKIT